MTEDKNKTQKYENGVYWTHPTFGPSSQAAWRKIEIKDGVVRIIEPACADYSCEQSFFFVVNTMVGAVDLVAKH